jgi:enoyl-CoA hydratase
MSIDRVIRIEREGHVATVWLDRTEARNAMASAFFEELPVAMAEVSSDDAVRAVVVAARGPDFTVGLDLKTIGNTLSDPATGAPDGKGGAGHPPSMATRAMRTRASILRLQKSISSVAACPKPVIAAIHGYCIGAGVDLVSACDIRLASSDTIFSVRETRMAIVADLGTLQRLPHIIGKGHLAELAYTGKDITAERAEEIGLVNEVLPSAPDAQKAAFVMASEIAANSPLVVQGTKEVLRACESRPVEEGLGYVAAWNAGFLQSDDLVEAVTAFMEKRQAQFGGR